MTPFRPKPESVWIFNPAPNHAAYEPVRQGKDEYDAWADRYSKAQHEVHFDPIDERMSELDSLEGKARGRLMQEPAPDLAALAYKLKLALEHDDNELRGDERQALQRDSDRLA